MNLFKSLFYLSTSAVLILLFQNCGGGAVSSLGQETDSSGNPIVVPQSDPNHFNAGDDFDSEKVPVKVGDAELNEGLQNYLVSDEMYKAIALTSDGRGYIGLSSDPLIEDQADWNRAVLERCQIQTRSSCALLAEGNQFKQEVNAFLNGFNSQLLVPADLDTQMLPGEIQFWKDHAADYYANGSAEFKSIAINQEGQSIASSSSENQQEANKRALERCEAFADSPCTLYSVGAEVVFDLQTYTLAPKTIVYAPADFDSQKVPFVKEKARNGLFKTYQDDLKSGKFKFGIATISKFGNGFVKKKASAITNADRKEAINKCNSGMPEDTSGNPVSQCFIYAENLQVVMTRESYLDAVQGGK